LAKPVISVGSRAWEAATAAWRRDCICRTAALACVSIRETAFVKQQHLQVLAFVNCICITAALAGVSIRRSALVKQQHLQV
jgi:hypothetical protein